MPSGRPESPGLSLCRVHTGSQEGAGAPVGAGRSCASQSLCSRECSHTSCQGSLDPGLHGERKAPLSPLSADWVGALDSHPSSARSSKLPRGLG